jgi:hypothetical protein
MRVTVWAENTPYDDEDEPMVDGLIDLDEPSARDLTERLDRFEAEGVIGSYELYDYDAPSPVVIEGIYNFVTGDLDHKDESLRALWEGRNG